MRTSTGEYTFEPGCEEYVEAYVKFYAKREGINSLDSLDIERRETLSLRAKTHLVDDLYKNLDTLDTKASALLAFCGLALAAITAMITFREFSKYTVLLYLILAAILISSVQTLTVIRVRWSTSRELGQRTLDEACYSYYTAKMQRTREYIAAWNTTTLTIKVFGGYVVLDLILSAAKVVNG